jgi:hypothetical protein
MAATSQTLKWPEFFWFIKVFSRDSNIIFHAQCLQRRMMNSSYQWISFSVDSRYDLTEGKQMVELQTYLNQILFASQKVPSSCFQNNSLFYLGKSPWYGKRTARYGQFEMGDPQFIASFFLNTLESTSFLLGAPVATVNGYFQPSQGQGTSRSTWEHQL